MRHFWNPFYKLGGWKALLIGLIGLIITGWLGGVFNTHFDGIIDVHSVKEVKPMIPLLENFINWAILTCVWGIAAAILNGFRFRIVDLMGIMAIVRLPFIIIPPLTFLFSVNEKVEQIIEMLLEPSKQVTFTPLDSFSFIISVMLSIVFVILSVIWMYNGFKILSNSKGIRLNITFITGIILSELFSKLLIAAIVL